MDLFSTLKCILCLVKCSKYLYYIKKILCGMSIVLAVVALICGAKNSKCVLRKLGVM